VEKQKMSGERNIYLNGSKYVDYDLHNLVGIRVVNATQRALKAIQRQIGRLPTNIHRLPDIEIIFTDKIKPVGELFYIGLNFAGYDSGGNFYIINNDEAHSKMAINFDQIDETLTVICEREITSIPLLNHLINFNFLKKGYVPLHASAFKYENNGILVAGWTKGGKTESLLAFLKNGAQYVGDEWVMISENGDKMYGIPYPICVWDWQLPYIKNLIPGINFQKKMTFKAIYFFDWSSRNIINRIFPNSFLSNLSKQLVQKFNKQLHVRIDPIRLLQGEQSNVGCKIDKIFFLMSHDNKEIVIERIDPLEIAMKMSYSNIDEQSPFFEYYNAFRFAYPDRENLFFDNIFETQTSMLHHALRNKESYVVRHPYPVNLDELFQVMEPVCRSIPVSI